MMRVKVNSDVIAAVLFCAAGFAAIWAAISSAECKALAERLQRLQFTNPYARFLGKIVEAKIYEASDWERVLVVAVSWKGSLCVRPVRDLGASARWIHKGKVPMRVREIKTQTLGV